MWEDNIQGHVPLSTKPSLIEINIWLVNKGLLQLVDIPMWESKGNWIDWQFTELPEWLNSQKTFVADRADRKISK